MNAKNFARKAFDVLTVTGDGVELWKNDLTFDEALEEIKNAKSEFGGRYWIEEGRINPLDRKFSFYERYLDGC